MRIAILLEDLAQSSPVSGVLRSAGHVTQDFGRGTALLAALERETFDAVVLDCATSDLHGVEVLDRIRVRLRSSVPVLCVGRDRESDVVTALRRGADAYMTKPIRGLELVARLEALSRRTRYPDNTEQALEVGPFRVDFHTRTIERDGRCLRLTATDFDVSVLFLRNVGRLLSRGHLRDSVWGQRAPASSRTVDTYVCRVRSRLGLRPEHGWALEPVYRYGYRLKQLGATDAPAARDASSAPGRTRTPAPGHAERRIGAHAAVRQEAPRGESRPGAG